MSVRAFGPTALRKRARRVAVLAAALLLGAACRGSASGPTVPLAPAASQWEGASHEPTPTYEPYAPTLPAVVSVGPLYTTGSAGVDPAALPRAGAMLAVMLRNRPDVGEELRKAGALTAVFARNETVCDLPYFADLPDRAKCREPGGLGGTRRRPATACSERNIMGSSDDHFGRGTRSNGENVCVHELAHTIMNVGLSQEERNQIERRYHVAGLTNLWTGDYALRDADEFFAEMSQSYFCANPASPGHVHTHVANCAAALAAYDPESYALVENIYRGAADLR